MKAKIFYGGFSSLTRKINKSGALLRVDCHFNSFSNQQANYSWAKYRTGDSISKPIASYLCNKTGANLGIKAKEVAGLSPGQRGYPIFRGMKIPTILWEPCFCSNPQGAKVIKSRRSLLHDSFMDMLKHSIPSGAMVALVPGHAHKKSNDMGAPVYGGGTEAKYTEVLCQELAALINSKPVDLQGDEEEMVTKEGTIHTWHVRVDSNNQPWLNLGNDTAAPIDVTVVACPARNEDDPNASTKNSEPVTKKVAAFSPRNPGVDIRELVRRKLPNFSGIVMVTAKGSVPFSSSVEVLNT